MSNAESALAKVEHIVVLMLENRSFDHMLGYLSLEGGRDDIDGLQAGMANDYGGRSYPIHHLDRTAFEPVEDPDHSGEATSVQIAGGAMNGFVHAVDRSGSNGRQAMGYYDDSSIPYYWNLADKYVLFDRFFSSSQGSRQISRNAAKCFSAPATSPTSR